MSPSFHRGPGRGGGRKDRELGIVGGSSEGLWALLERDLLRSLPENEVQEGGLLSNLSAMRDFL